MMMKVPVALNHHLAEKGQREVEMVLQEAAVAGWNLYQTTGQKISH